MADVRRHGMVDPDSDLADELQADYEQLVQLESWERPAEEVEPVVAALHAKLEKITDKMEGPAHELRANMLFDSFERGRSEGSRHEYTDVRGRLIRDTRVGQYVRSEILLSAKDNTIFRTLVERATPAPGRSYPTDADVEALNQFAEQHGISRGAPRSPGQPEMLLGEEAFAGVSPDAVAQRVHVGNMMRQGAKVLRDGTRVVIQPESQEGGA